MAETVASTPLLDDLLSDQAINEPTPTTGYAPKTPSTEQPLERLDHHQL
jgi:hypothetical protein